MSEFEEFCEMQKEQKKPDIDGIMLYAEVLNEESDSDSIQRALLLAEKLPVLQQRRVLLCIKKNTGIPLHKLEEAICEDKGPDSKEPDQHSFAMAILERHGRENLLATAAHTFQWDGAGVWRVLDERALKKLVQSVLVEIGVKVSRGLVDAVTEVLKTEIYIPYHEWNYDPDVINFKNGELRYRAGQWVLEEHCREHYLATQIPHSYDQVAKAPLFQKFLNEIFDGDEDADEKITLCLEMIGYSLVSHARYEAFILLIGKGGNGKSVLLHILALIVGKKNIAAVTPSKFSVSSDRAHLYNKLINLVTEIPEGIKIADAELKSITSGELITASSKYGHPFEFSPIATNWFAANHMPYTSDHSDGLFRRAFIIWFNKKFERGKNADPKLKDKLEKEVQGIIALALDAYGKVIERDGKFTEPASSSAAKEEWKYEVNQVEQFVDEMCIRDPNARTVSAEVFSAYKGYADEMGFRRLNHNSLTRRLKMSGFSTVRTGEARMISGLRLIEPDNEAELHE